MAAIKLTIGLFLCLLGTTVIATTSSPVSAALSSATFSVSPPHHQLNASTSKVVPSKHIGILLSEGIVGVQLPGCAETFDTGVQQQHQQQQQPRRMREQFDESTDSHQKVHRFKQGDIIAIPAGAVHWTYNDGNQEVVAIAVDDINNPPTNSTCNIGQHVQGQQGGRKRSPIHRQQQGSFNVQSIYAGFDTELLAESFNTDTQIMRAVQESSDRGLIVKVQQRMEFVTLEEQQEQRRQRRSGGSSNGLEEKICSSKFVFNLEKREGG
ncbi:hypothetical protein L1987_29172 [Smallanthus sonchifolius]|uniref:Uncharacterized protein n=1 Tax=Smallanthus sonchifolius TaxID=185202 RepID=A0ACB9I0R3_9ASTR|nr:hypothetical protein L1987_29172 [Smallanthus sonchifolius]